MMDDQTAAQALGALSQIHRLMAFRALVVAGQGGLTPGALAERLDISAASMSFHLKELLRTGMVSQTRDGRHLIYRASFERMNGLLAFLTTNCCEGQPCELTPAHPFSPTQPQPKEPFMADKTYNVLFVCTGNSARSILAEALMNHLGEAKGFRAYSAGSHPKGEVNPWALKTLADMHFATEGYRSKAWEEFAQPDAPQFDFVFTVCDQAAGEVCPVWPGQPMTAHWGMPDPGEVVGTDAEIQQAFRNTFITLKRRIELMLALPMASLDRLAIHREVKNIGTQ